MGPGADGQVAPPPHRIEIGAGGAPPSPVLDVGLIAAEPFLGFAVEVFGCGISGLASGL